MKIGYWTKLPSGMLSARENYPRFRKNFDDFLNAAEFMTLNANISSKISDSGQCWYETFTIPTTKALETEFIAKLNSLLTEFRSKSESVPGEIMVSWAQIYTHALNGSGADKEVQ